LVRFHAARTADDHWEERWLLWATLRLAHVKLLHIVDGDFDTWAYAPRPSWLRTRVTATFHQPIDRLAGIVSAIRPGSLDGILCVSRPQLQFLEPLVPAGRCIFLPHGVDTDFFRPAVGLRDPRPMLLCVGAHRRDFATLLAAARGIRASRPDVTVRLVAPQPAADAVRSDGGGAVEVLSGISDEELLEQYRAATLLLLPLEAATANNALLEAMACGLPSVITDVPDLHDYVTDDAAVFCRPSDPKAHATAALSLLDDLPRRARLSAAARAQAEALSWPKIRARANEFFRGVVAG
jgi:glycosyltransferase involved in cell wall biosynthesis